MKMRLPVTDIVLDLNIFTYCNHISHETEFRNFDHRMKRKVNTILTQVKRGTYIRIPSRQYKYLQNLVKLVTQTPLDPNISKFLTFFTTSANIKTISITNREECKEISGFCAEEYKAICSAIMEYARSKLLAITCTGKTFDVNGIRRKIGGSTCETIPVTDSVYIVLCNVTDEDVDNISKALADD